MKVKELIIALLDEDMEKDLAIKAAGGNFWGIVGIDGISDRVIASSYVVLMPDREIVVHDPT